jgi:hypothetical protein
MSISLDSSPQETAAAVSSPSSSSEGTTSSGSDQISEMYKKLADAVRAKDDWELLLATLQSRCICINRKDVTDAQLRDAEDRAHALLRAVADMRSFRNSANSAHAIPSFELEKARERILEARYLGNFRAETFMSAINHLFMMHDVCGSVSLVDGGSSDSGGGKLLITATYAKCTGSHHALASLLPASTGASSGDADQKQDSDKLFRGLLLGGVEYMQKGLDGGEVETIVELCDRLLESAYPCKCIITSSSQDAEHAHGCSWRDRLVHFGDYPDVDSEPPSPYDPYDWD